MDRLPAVPDLRLPATPMVRLVVEPIPDARGISFLDEDHRAAITLALEEAKGTARVINTAGPSAIFDEQGFLEVRASAVPKLQNDLETLGLRVSRLDQLVANIRSTRKALAIGSDDDLAAAAARLIDNERHPRDQSEELGALLTAVESQDVSRFSPQARHNVWPQVGGSARDEVEALEREVKARAAKDGLTLYP